MSRVNIPIGNRIKIGTIQPSVELIQMTDTLTLISQVDPSLKDSYTTPSIMPLLITYSSNWHTWIFTPTSSYALTGVYVLIVRTATGDSSKIATGRIRATSGGLPSGSNLGSVDVPQTSVPTVVGYVLFDFSPPINVVSGTTYAFVLSSNAVIANDGVIGESDNLSGSNIGRSTDAGSSWSSLSSRHGNYRIWGT